MTEPMLTIVVPCYNEEKVLPDTIGQLSLVLARLIREKLIHTNSKLLLIDDGSQDATWTLIETISEMNPFLAGIKLTRNVGHQQALLAGMLQAKKYSDCIISIDADLQDDASVIRNFILKYLEGYDVVYGVRNRRDTDTWFKRTSAILFYRFMQKMGVNIMYNHADYRLLSSRALEELSRYRESHLFLRGIIPLLGLRYTSVTYDRKARLAGESKYPLKKMLSFALNGITSFSVTPIRWITILGCIIFCMSLALGGYALYERFLGFTTPGWTSLAISIWLLGGIQLMSVGVIGEYIGKTYTEVKQRPRYSIEAHIASSQLQVEDWSFIAEDDQEQSS